MPKTERSPELMLGTLALKAGYVTRKQLQECLRDQLAARSKGQTLPLGQLMVRKGYMKEKNLAFLLQNHEYIGQRSEDKLFGQIAVANGFLSPKDMDVCLDEQRDLYFAKHVVKRIGQLLVEKGLLTQQEAEAVVTAQERIRATAKPQAPAAPPAATASKSTAARPAASAPAPQISWETVELEAVSAPPPPPPPQTTRKSRPAPTKLRRGPDPTKRQ